MSRELSTSTTSAPTSPPLEPNNRYFQLNDLVPLKLGDADSPKGEIETLKHRLAGIAVESPKYTGEDSPDSVDIVDIIVHIDDFLDSVDNSNATAAVSSFLPLIHLLYGANRGNTIELVIMSCIYEKKEEVALEIIKQFDFNELTQFSRLNLLSSLSCHGSSNLLNSLTMKISETNYRNYAGKSPLTQAAEAGKQEAAITLINSGHIEEFNNPAFKEFVIYLINKSVPFTKSLAETLDEYAIIGQAYLNDEEFNNPESNAIFLHNEPSLAFHRVFANIEELSKDNIDYFISEYGSEDAVKNSAEISEYVESLNLDYDIKKMELESKAAILRTMSQAEASSSSGGAIGEAPAPDTTSAAVETLENPKMSESTII